MPRDISDEELAALYVCSDRPTPENKVIAAAMAAIEENPDNAPIREIPPGGMGVDPNGPVEMALVAAKKWQPGRTIKCAFLDGQGAVKDKVIEHAKVWEQHANLKLDFGGDGDADIRISFTAPGSWSYLGTDALVIDDDEATMNYGWLKPNTPSDEYSRVVLHEFGHAFGCIHEHSHPEAGIPWDEEKVYRYYQLTNGWDRAKTFHNVIRRYNREGTNFSAYDGTSIMQYSVPEELTIGDFSIGWNRTLSDTDKSFIAAQYPRAAREPGELRPGDRQAASIGEHGEEDHYHFKVDAAGRYTIETHGSTDVVMALYGPDDRTLFRTSDDDSGRARNAKISTNLPPGTYFVRVRHYWPTGTGKYEVSLSEG